MKRIEIYEIIDDIWVSLHTSVADHSNVFIESELWNELYIGINNVKEITIEMELRYEQN